MNAPWLSIVMPVHAGGRWLRETLASVAPQADGVEVILLDSSEDDACERIAASFAGNLDLRYQRRPDLKGWPAKTNAAIAAARAPYVAMLHQDDLWLAGRAATLKRMIEAAPEAALLLFPTRIIDADGGSLGVWRCPLPSGRNLLIDEFAERLLVQNFISVPAPVIRRDAWLAAGGMDEALWYTGDWDVYLKLARQGPVRYEPVCTTAFRIHPTSLTVSGSRDRADFVAQMEHIIDRHSDLLRGAQRQQVLRCARASISVNDALAAAARGERHALKQAALAVVKLTPGEMYRYWRDSRLGERLWPRLRAKLAGRF